MKPTVITYTRFSSLIQKEGLSQYRQDELTQRHVIDFCKKHDIGLDEVISLKDKGVSAYRGKNLTQGSLAQIIEKFKSGELEKTYNEKGEINTFLFVESLDRLTRADLHKATSIFLTLVEYCNIVVVADNEAKTYSIDSLRDQIGMFDLFQALLVISRSHGESLMKENRSRASWVKKRKDIVEYFELTDEEKANVNRPKNPTKTCPWWLKPKKNNIGFEFIEENKNAMLFFLDLLLDDYGFTSAVRKLNDKIESGELPVIFTGRQKRANGFQIHTFYPLFKGDSNESVIGNLIFHQEYYPNERDIQQGLYPKSKEGKRTKIRECKVEGFYPALISELDYLRIRKKVDDRKQSQAKPSKKIRNIAQSILKCPICGYSFSYVADNRKGRYHYLVCSLSRAKKCRSHTYRYSVFENNFLNFCRNINISRVLGKDNGSDYSSKIKEKESEVERLLISKKLLGKELDQIVENISKISIQSLIDKTQKNYALKENKIEIINADIKKNEVEIHQLKTQQSSISNVNNTIYNLIDEVSTKKDVDIREKLNIELKKIIKSMYLISHKSEGNIFGVKLLSVEFLDGYIRLIPLKKELENEGLYEILPALELKEAKDFSKYKILPFDYIEGLESGKYPDVPFMSKYYQENPDVLTDTINEIKKSDDIFI